LPRENKFDAVSKINFCRDPALAPTAP